MACIDVTAFYLFMRLFAMSPNIPRHVLANMRIPCIRLCYHGALHQLMPMLDEGLSHLGKCPRSSQM